MLVWNRRRVITIRFLQNASWKENTFQLDTTRHSVPAPTSGCQEEPPTDCISCGQMSFRYRSSWDGSLSSVCPSLFLDSRWDDPYHESSSLAKIQKIISAHSELLIGQRTRLLSTTLTFRYIISGSFENSDSSICKNLMCVCHIPDNNLWRL